MTPYEEFLKAKAAIAPRFGGLQVDENDLNPELKPHTRRMVAWAINGGRREFIQEAKRRFHGNFAVDGGLWTARGAWA